MLLPYLREPVFLDEGVVRFHRDEHSVTDALDAELIELVFEGGSDLDQLAERVVAHGRAPDSASARATLVEAFSDPHGLIGLIDVPVEDAYDVVLVEQGYGGVYVHTVELAKKLQAEHSCLLISPVDPLFDDQSVEHVVTLPRLRKLEAGLSYFSYLHLARTIVRRTRCKLLLIAHRSQSLYLFDLIKDQPTIIFCDGFYDGLFRMSVDLKFPGGERARRRVLSEIYYLISNTTPGFHGLMSSPSQNHFLLMAGYRSLRDARENWCWGHHQTEGFKRAFPKLRRPIRFVPPFTDPDLFDADQVDRERVVLFTTTMHNIELKGFPELVKAMVELPEMRVRCVVRQPEHLPEYPDELEERFTMGAVPKSEMVGLYHRVWVNCRTSREESSPVSILEAMTCEIPQIVSPAVAEQIPIIEDGVTGYVIDPDDTPGLVRALSTILGDAELRDRMGAAARERACTYSLESRWKLFSSYLD